MFHSPISNFRIRFGVLVALMTLVGLGFSLMPGPRVSAEAGDQPAFQETSYPADNGDVTEPTAGYDAPATEESPAQATPTTRPTNGTPAATISATLPTSLAETVTPSITPPPDVFRTEDSEMNGGLVTPPASETPGPTRTAVPSQTMAATPTPRVSAAKAGQGFAVDWGLFWFGFSLPVLAGCGVVLYLLDHKPGLFR